MKFEWKQLAIAITLFLAGYFTFNGGFFSKSGNVSSEKILPIPAAQKAETRAPQAGESGSAY